MLSNDADAERAERHRLILESWDEFTEADALIFNELAEWPLPIMTLLNRVTRKLGRTTRRHRLAAKWAILKRLGSLIRQKRLCRFHRTLVSTPGYKLPSEVPAWVLQMLTNKPRRRAARQKQGQHPSSSVSTAQSPQ
jgi:hypothetical protein